MPQFNYMVSFEEAHRKVEAWFDWWCDQRALETPPKRFMKMRTPKSTYWQRDNYRERFILRKRSFHQETRNGRGRPWITHKTYDLRRMAENIIRREKMEHHEKAQAGNGKVEII